MPLIKNTSSESSLRIRVKDEKLGEDEGGEEMTLCCGAATNKAASDQVT